MLTRHQHRLYGYLARYSRTYGHGPSPEEIRQFLGVKSLRTVDRHLRRLVGLGVIRMEPRERAIRVVPMECVELPIVSYVPIVPMPGIFGHWLREPDAPGERLQLVC